MAISGLTAGIGGKKIPRSTILFKTDFTNTSKTGYLTAGASAKDKLSGANGGYAWPVSGGGSNQRLNAIEAYIQLISDWGSVTTANNANYGTAIISAVNDLPGYSGNQLSLVLLDSGKIDHVVNTPFDGQNDFIFSRAADSAAIPPDLTDFYLRFYVKFPGSLYTALQAGVSNHDRMILSEWKEGGYVTPWDSAVHYVGSMRINTAIQKAENGIMYINTHADQGANGNGIIPSTIDKSAAWSVTAADYWSVDSYASPIVFDQWMKFEYYMHRHETAGVFKSALNDIITCNYVGRTLGQYRCPIGRLMPFMAYTGALPDAVPGQNPCAVSGCNLEMRDYPPAGSVLVL